MGLEYGIRIGHTNTASDGKQAEWLLDMLHSRLVFAFGNDETYRIVYHHHQLTVLQQYDRWPEVLEISLEYSRGELEGTVAGERYVYILCHIGGSLVQPLLAVVDDVLKQFLPGTVREEL
ncbi:hypothetical protein [Paenibacillus campi]|uniref:hypothetical protein n=1 Tax=Paenibacillus campi TaxID=3106031 RepID=UPI002AFE2183|nr:hypothetical protein [Paenibacillus sp. SGZ-1014]